MFEPNKIYQGNTVELVKQLEDESINCCVTSPPYFGLRDYGTAKWEGGNPLCEHIGSIMRTAPPGTAKQASNQGASSVMSGDCRCGAKRVDIQLGLENTPEEYVSNMVKVFSEVKRSLKSDGTFWLNIGDSYYNYRPGKGQGLPKQTVSATKQDLPDTCARRGNKLEGLKEKDLIGIPWMLAFALRSNGWYLRQDIIWAKGNPMPESVEDRCTKSHEYLFLLTKNKNYNFNYKAIREKGVCPAGTKGAKGSAERFGTDKVNSRPPEYKVYDGMRNKRDVWQINNKPFKGAHFAVMPEALVEPCILAGCPENGLVFDPFSGAATVAVVAKKLKRNYLGFELNPKYIEISESRLANVK